VRTSEMISAQTGYGGSAGSVRRGLGGTQVPDDLQHCCDQPGVDLGLLLSTRDTVAVKPRGAGHVYDGGHGSPMVAVVPFSRAGRLLDCSHGLEKTPSHC